MAANKKSDPPATENTPADKRVTIGGNVVDSVVIVGNENTVNKTTIIQKFFNIFKSDSETLEHRNRRILLGHVENAWIKGVLDASLHGAALLDLGIKQDLEAVTKYPWAIKKESTNETLPTGTSMLEIFDSIGMGRSLLILGAPGSGKTTMLLELARQMIQRAREDVTQPIPMVFNLASWTEKLNLADWLAQELNNLYSVPRKTAPDWVKGNKLLLLLDGLDEVRQDSRAKCVEAINEFRKEHGLTSLAVCSRSQDYADLNTKLSFEGAIEVQPLTQKQITEFFNSFGDEMAGIKQALEKDRGLREMAETPLFLSIMLITYQSKKDVNFLVSLDENTQRRYILDNYIEGMFDHSDWQNELASKKMVLHRLSWLAINMRDHNQWPYYLENMQPTWLSAKKQMEFNLIIALSIELAIGLILGLGLSIILGLNVGVILGLIIWLIFELKTWHKEPYDINSVDTIKWDWGNWKKNLGIMLFVALLSAIAYSGVFSSFLGQKLGSQLGISVFLGVIMFGSFISGLKIQPISQSLRPNQRIFFSLKSFLITCLIFVPFFVCFARFVFNPILELTETVAIANDISMGLYTIPELIFGLIIGGGIGFWYGGFAVTQHYALRFILWRDNLLPWRLVPFLDHCVDLIFLRRVGGGYIFVHRLLMEHFAEMYVEDI